MHDLWWTASARFEHSRMSPWLGLTAYGILTALTVFCVVMCL